jgi:hypothetical protein
MALADTGKAIGSVTKLLIDRLGTKTGYNITVGRPEPPANGVSGKRLNLFLYEALFDPSLKNVSLDEGQPPPLWLVLKYLLTAFDDDGNSDTALAHEYLGEGIRAIQDSSFLYLTTSTTVDIRKALNDNPEILKLTFDNIPSDLLSKLMQGSDEKYRFSVGFEVRPVMIATGEPVSYSLLVGIDYTASPNQVIGEKGIQIPVIPSMGSTITMVSPSRFEVGSILTILGSDLNLSALTVSIGQAELAVTFQQPNKLQCVVDGAIVNGNTISAGSHPISVIQTLPTGRRRSSNLLVVDLMPTLTSVTLNSLTHVTPGDPTSNVFGNIVMTGILLGGENDDIFVALYKDGMAVKVFDEFTVTPAQSALTLAIEQSQAVPPGKYLVILRVNGQQAKNSPEVDLL